MQFTVHAIFEPIQAQPLRELDLDDVIANNGYLIAPSESDSVLMLRSERLSLSSDRPKCPRSPPHPPVAARARRGWRAQAGTPWCR
jgi:hypothetical protein